MSLVKSPEMTEENLAAHQANGRQTQGPATPEGKAQSAAANLRHGFCSQGRAEVLSALGEKPEEYVDLAESMLEDLRPAEGLEKQLVLQMIETVWRMRRAQRMQEGVALKRLQARMPREELVATMNLAKALENLQSFEHLHEALSRRGQGVTPEEIRAFATSRQGDSSEETKEFIALLKSLHSPMDDPQRKAALRQARAETRRFRDAHETAAWHMSRRAEGIRSPENLAALTASTDTNTIFLQRVEDSSVRRLWRLTNTLMKVRQARHTQKDVKNEGRPGDVYENK